MPILYPKALRDDAERNEADALIQMPSVEVGGDDSVELHDLGCILPTPNAPEQRVFLRGAALY